MSDYNYDYYYSREYIEELHSWNIDYPGRVDSEGNQMYLADEIHAVLPDKIFLFYAGYDNDPKKVVVKFTTELSESEKNTLDTTVYNHKNNT